MIRSILTLVALAGFCLVMTGCGGGSSTDADGTTAEDRAADRGELRGAPGADVAPTSTDGGR